MNRHLHLDLVGGLSGDMFISGMLDAFPEWQLDLESVISDAGFPSLVQLTRAPFDDGTLTGTRFKVDAAEEAEHHHRHYSQIRDTINRSALSESVKSIALEVFRLIAEVEAAIHGKTVEKVAFHEVGAWDSIADIILAATMIDLADAASFSISAIPVGRGSVETAHGRLPVPAPATAKLLQGFHVIDDGIEGERVTPTGAAIIRFLNPAASLPSGLRMGNQGYGFGTKKFPGISNVVRITRYESAEEDAPWDEDSVCALSFEIDDQTAESLAAALDEIRQHEAVLDVTQQAVFGKKQRQGSSISVLVTPGGMDAVTSLIFEMTTTLGVRREVIQRAVLPREAVTVTVGELKVRVKVARRPNGYTAKVEMDDLVAADLSRHDLEQVRIEAERIAIEAVRAQRIKPES